MRTILASAVLVALSSTVDACSFKQRTDEELMAVAKAVFRARVVEVKLSNLPFHSDGSRTFEVVEARFEVKEILKGTPPVSGIVRDVPFGPGNCGLGLMVGLEYVFFPEENDMVLIPTGSFGYFNADGTQVKPRLESLRKLAKVGK